MGFLHPWDMQDLLQSNQHLELIWNSLHPFVKINLDLGSQASIPFLFESQLLFSFKIWLFFGFLVIRYKYEIKKMILIYLLKVIRHYSPMRCRCKTIKVNLTKKNNSGGKGNAFFLDFFLLVYKLVSRKIRWCEKFLKLKSYRIGRRSLFFKELQNFHD